MTVCRLPEVNSLADGPKSDSMDLPGRRLNWFRFPMLKLGRWLRWNPRLLRYASTQTIEAEIFNQRRVPTW